MVILIVFFCELSTTLRKVRKMKATFHTLNLCNMDITSKCLLAEAWVPVSDMAFVQNALNRGQVASGSNVHPILHQVETDQTPPTYNRTNKFTNGFQNIIDAYGVATYQEFNPTPFTVITFPFLFAVMFGDAGHGLLMFLFALWMILSERSLAAKQNETDNEVNISTIHSVLFGDGILRGKNLLHLFMSNPGKTKSSILLGKSISIR